MMRLRKYLAQSPAGRAIVLRSVVLLPVAGLLLRARGMGRTRAWLQRGGPFAEGKPSGLTPREIARLVGAVASLLRARCLPRSLVLLHFLRDRGASAEIRLGVTRLADGGVSAHAWVEFDGWPLNDGLDVSERYAVLPSLAGRISNNHAETRPF